MSFNTHTPGHVLIGDNDVIFGTAMLGDDFGEIIKCEIERTGKQIEVENNRGGLRAFIIANLGLAMNVECNFDETVVPPDVGEAIAFPYVGVTGRVTDGGKIMWENGGVRRLSFQAVFFDAMGETSNPAFTVGADGVGSSPIAGIAP